MISSSPRSSYSMAWEEMLLIKRWSSNCSCPTKGFPATICQVWRASAQRIVSTWLFPLSSSSMMRSLTLDCSSFDSAAPPSAHRTEHSRRCTALWCFGMCYSDNLQACTFPLVKQTHIFTITPLPCIPVLLPMTGSTVEGFDRTSLPYPPQNFCYDVC